MKFVYMKIEKKPFNIKNRNMPNNSIDYKKQKQEAKKNKRTNSTRSSQVEEEPYYKKKSKRKPPVMDSMDEDQETWAKGKLKSGNLFSDSDSEPVNNKINSDSDEETPVPVSIVKKNEKNFVLNWKT